MTQSGDPLKNAVAERANGILKTEWLYRTDIPDGKSCKQKQLNVTQNVNQNRYGVNQIRDMNETM